MIIIKKEGKLIVKNKLTTVELAENGVTINDYLLPGPGEYEVGGVLSYGLGEGGYVFKDEEFGYGYLDGIKKELEEKKLDDLPDVEVLFVNIADGKNISAIEKNIKIFDPRIVVEYGEDDNAENIVSNIGRHDLVVGTLKLKKTDLPLEGQKVYFIK